MIHFNFVARENNLSPTFSRRVSTIGHSGVQYAQQAKNGNYPK